jgi:hypothetical protein
MSKIFEIIDSIDKGSLDIKSGNKHLLVNEVSFSKHASIPDKKIIIPETGEMLNSVSKSEITYFLYPRLDSLYPETMSLFSKHINVSDKLNISCLNKEENAWKNELIAQIIWYIDDGFGNTANEIMLNNVNGFKKILIKLEQPAKQLIFYYGDTTNRCWMEIQKDSLKNPFIIACIEENYKNACNHVVSLKWIWHQQRVVKKN